MHRDRILGIRDASSRKRRRSSFSRLITKLSFRSCRATAGRIGRSSFAVSWGYASLITREEERAANLRSRVTCRTTNSGATSGNAFSRDYTTGVRVKLTYFRIIQISAYRSFKMKRLFFPATWNVAFVFSHPSRLPVRYK